MRYYLQIVEAIINGRISDAVKLDGFLQLLDQLEFGYLPMLLIFGTQEVTKKCNRCEKQFYQFV